MLIRLIFIALLVTHLGAQPSFAVQKTAKEENDLTGPVRAVTTQLQGFSVKESYDRAGNVTEATIRLDHENTSTHYVFTYNQQGDLQEELAHNPDGSLVYRKLFARAHDRGGRETGEVSASPTGEFFHAEFSTYDEQGHLAEMLFIGSMGSNRNVYDVLGRLIYSGWYRGGQLVSEVVHSYDVEGRLIRHRSYNASGALTGEDRYEYDEQGRRIATRTEKALPGTPSRWITTYEYDARGNWTKEFQQEDPLTPPGTEPAPPTLLRSRITEYYDLP